MPLACLKLVDDFIIQVIELADGLICILTNKGRLFWLGYIVPNNFLLNKVGHIDRYSTEEKIFEISLQQFKLNEAEVEHVQTIAAATCHVILLTSLDRLLVIGDNDQGQLGMGSETVSCSNFIALHCCPVGWRKKISSGTAPNSTPTVPAPPAMPSSPPRIAASAATFADFNLEPESQINIWPRVSFRQVVNIFVRIPLLSKTIEKLPVMLAQGSLGYSTPYGSGYTPLTFEEMGAQLKELFSRLPAPQTNELHQKLSLPTYQLVSTTAYWLPESEGA